MLHRGREPHPIIWPAARLVPQDQRDPFCIAQSTWRNIDRKAPKHGARPRRCGRKRVQHELVWHALLAFQREVRLPEGQGSRLRASFCRHARASIAGLRRVVPRCSLRPCRITFLQKREPKVRPSFCTPPRAAEARERSHRQSPPILPTATSTMSSGICSDRCNASPLCA